MISPRFSCVSTLAFALVASGIAGCTMPYKTLEPHPGPNVSADFDGVKQLLKSEVANRKSGQNPAEVDVVMVHGMCTHKDDWAVGSLTQLAKTLGAIKPLKIEPVIKPEGSNAEVRKAVVEIEGGIVRMSTIVWSPIIFPLKGKLCYDQTQKSEMCTNLVASGSIEDKPYLSNRVLINSKAKDVLLDDCLADAMIYQGRARNEISEQLQSALMTAVIPDTQPLSRAETLARAKQQLGIPLVLITESLGSKMTLDAIQHLAMGKTTSDTIEAGYITFKRTAKIFMAANQIPLLQLADLDLKGKPQVDALMLQSAASRASMQGPLHNLDSSVIASEAFTAAAIAEQAPSDRDGFYADPLEVLYNAMGKSDPQYVKDNKSVSLYSTGQLPSYDPLVIALSDPNDFFSYSLVSARLVDPVPGKPASGKQKQVREADKGPSYPLFDFTVSNDWGYLWLLENPYTAHTTYLEQPNVMKLIACGTHAKDCE